MSSSLFTKVHFPTKSEKPKTTQFQVSNKLENPSFDQVKYVPAKYESKQKNNTSF